MTWEHLRASLVAKTIALVMLAVTMTATIASAAVIIYNADQGWYSKNEKQIEKAANQAIAYRISVDIANGEYDYLKKPEEGFGFIVKGDKSNPEAKTKRILNEELKKQPHYEFNHWDGNGELKITVYLGNILSEGTGRYTTQYSSYYKLYEYRNIAIGGLIGGFIISLCLIIFLLCAAGWTKDGLKVNFIDKIPFDLLCVAVGFIFLCFGMGIGASYVGDISSIVVAILMGMIFIAFAELICMTFATRVKLGKWWRNTICYRLLMKIKQLIYFIGGLITMLPMMWKTGLIAGAVCFVWLILIIGAGTVYYSGVFLFVGVLFSIILFFASIYFSLGLQNLKKAGQKLAEGDLDYHVDKKGLYLELAVHADHLNHIGEAMGEAVEERMKSERFKTELITNVSHDIKTPLTSIINYVDLLKKEELRDEKIKEYVDVLDRQSCRLKKLLEDLIDASKVATGAVTINKAPCQVGILMMQTLGEYEERLQRENLKVISSIPEEDFIIMADGRQLWRVFDNLMGNICKYSQPGTRVYIDLFKENEKVCITYKNISKYELNTKGEVFLERFMRGDRSRHTEGSGLGLSIAQSLINLQGGNLDVTIDGDLFKVKIEFEG